MKETKHLRFSEYPNHLKTKSFFVRNKHDDFLLGNIRWYGPWRQYCYFPVDDDALVFSAGCLRDIADFCAELMQERRRPVADIAGGAT